MVCDYYKLIFWENVLLYENFQYFQLWSITLKACVVLQMEAYVVYYTWFRIGL